MENSVFILSKQNIKISRFHICTWDIENRDSFVEIGIEFAFPENIDEVDFKLVVPFVRNKNYNSIKCLLSNLISDTENCKFIFNDKVKEFAYLDESKKGGGIITFENRNRVSILPIAFEIEPQVISMKVKNQSSEEPLSYIRVLVGSGSLTLARMKKGIAKTDYIFDFKLNERRNMPDNVYNIIRNEYDFCEIESSFCFHIVPNSFNISYVDQNKLRNIRELEVKAFQRYLPDELKFMKEGQYIIIFNKNQNSDAYSFFSIFTKETIGTKQLAFAIMANILCSLLFALAGFRYSLGGGVLLWKSLPAEYWIAFVILIVLILSLLSPHKQIKKLYNKIIK